MEENMNTAENLITKENKGKVFLFSKEDIELFNKLNKKLLDLCGRMDNTHFDISIALYTVYKKRLYLLTDYQNIQQFADSTYGIKSSQTYNYINVVKRFGDIQPDGSCCVLKKEYKDFTISKLTQMLSVPDDSLSKFEPSMTVKQIGMIAKSFQDDLKAKKAMKEITANSDCTQQQSKKAAISSEDELIYSKIIFEIKSKKSLEKLPDIIEEIEEKVTAAAESGADTYCFKIIQMPTSPKSTRMENKIL